MTNKTRSRKNRKCDWQNKTREAGGNRAYYARRRAAAANLKANNVVVNQSFKVQQSSSAGSSLSFLFPSPARAPWA